MNCYTYRDPFGKNRWHICAGNIQEADRQFKRLFGDMSKLVVSIVFYY